MIRKTFITSSLVFMTLPALAQRIEIGIGGGYAQFTAPTRYVKPITDFGYGFGNTFPVTLSARYTPADQRHSFLISVEYQRLSGGGSLPQLVSVTALRPGDIENESAIWSASLGIEWLLLTSGPSPHLVAELLTSSLGNINTTQGTWQGDFHATVPGGIRYGFSMGGGICVPLFFGAAINVDAKYVLHSLFGRASGEQSVNSLQFLGSIIVPIWSRKE